MFIIASRFLGSMWTSNSSIARKGDTIRFWSDIRNAITVTLRSPPLCV
jgi:hypothetical protein